MTANLPTGIISHTRKVQSLYKRIIRNIESWYPERYEATLMRQQFETNRYIDDKDTIEELINEAEKKLFRSLHYTPLKLATSPGGVAYQKNVMLPDWILDYWHPLEKAQYPEYFARRELRKKEYVKMWEKKYRNKSKQ